jgi:sodium/hydrogen antiporter
MTFNGWVTLVGLLLLAMALSSTWIRRLPLSTSALYLGVGFLLGPWVLGLLRIDFVEHARTFERLTEIAVVLSLFVGGLRLRLPWRHKAWRAVWPLASIVMSLSITGLALIASLLLHLPMAEALLIAAILAPTDPVLASSVTVGHSEDHDRLRYALSGEAGLNDGAAFPFVVLALLLSAGSVDFAMLGHWAVKDVLWASGAALAIGFWLGWLVGRTAIFLRSRQRDTAAPTDFLALALVALSYTAAQALGAWGFLAVFAAGVGLRRAELNTVEREPHPDAPRNGDRPHPPAETLVAPNTVTEDEIEKPAVAAGVLVAEVFTFGDTVERLLEVLLVVIVGAALATHVSWQGLALGAILIFVVRPLATFLGLLGTPTNVTQRALIGWFGIRGVGSLYYLSFVATHGVASNVAREVADICVTAIALSIILHGVTAQPLMQWYERRMRH